jgi:hypothetical protein
MPSVTAYGNVTSDMVDDGGGFILRGIRRRTLMPKIDRRTAVNRDHIGDSHCVKILDITNLPADIAGYSD